MQPARPSPQALITLHEQAAEWFMRRGEPTWTQADERALGDWLDADPLHREIFDDMALTSDDLHRLPLARAKARRAPAPSMPVAGRRAWGIALAACALLLAGGYGWHHWNHTATYTLDIATGHGEVREVELPDGSRAALNFDSAARVRYYPRRREVRLERGEAFFEVAGDAGRPFTVDSGTSRLKVLGTAFNVRAAPHLVVQVREGRVELQPDREATLALVMGPGAGVAIDPATGRQRSVPTTADSVGDWRSGQIHFRRTPLAEVVQELSRYLGRSVTLADPELASQPISGVAATADPQAFLLALPGFLPVRVQALPGGDWRISRR